MKWTVFSLWCLCHLPFHPLTADLEAKAGEQKKDQNADQNSSNNKCGITGFSPNAKLDFPLECFKIAAINFQCCITNVGPIINPLLERSEVFSETILRILVKSPLLDNSSDSFSNFLTTNLPFF